MACTILISWEASCLRGNLEYQKEMFNFLFFERIRVYIILYEILCVKSVLFLKRLPTLKAFNSNIRKIIIFAKSNFHNIKDALNNLILYASWNVNNEKIRKTAKYLLFIFLWNWAKFVKFTEFNLHDSKLQTLTGNGIHLLKTIL